MWISQCDLRGIPLAIGVVASSSFWNVIGGLGCLASSRTGAKTFSVENGEGGGG